MWNVLVCDADEAFLESIKKDIIRVAGNKIKKIESFREKEGLEFYAADHPHETNIIILDIDPASCRGIRAAEKVLEHQPNSQIIFTSDGEEYVPEIYDVDHVYLLKKPVDVSNLEKALNRACEKMGSMKVSMLSVSNKQGMHNIPLNEILFFENERRRVHIHTRERKISYYGRFDNLTEKLDDSFVRCHNSYIVNLARVREMSDKKFHFDEAKVVPISKTYFAEVREAFVSFTGREMLCLDSGNKNEAGEL